MDCLTHRWHQFCDRRNHFIFSMFGRKTDQSLCFSPNISYLNYSCWLCFPFSSCFQKKSIGARAMTKVLRTYVDSAEDLSSVPHKSFVRIAKPWNSSSRKPETLCWSLWVSADMSLCAPTPPPHTHTYILCKHFNLICISKNNARRLLSSQWLVVKTLNTFI